MPQATSKTNKTESEMTGTLINDIIETVDNTLGTADVWHPGSRSFYRARLLRKLTHEEALFDPTEGFPLDDNTVGEPLDEMERRTR